ncbi:MAG TPA: DUF4492 domain-containing protein [Draconibacterium sp.]|nr:DUF4492 domain-containing protein [Draconibacterium sp.]
MKRQNIFLRVLSFYFSGFKNMSNWSRQVWIIILVKLFIMFVILKIFFFPDFLKTNFDNDAQRSEHVLEVLTKSK